MSVERQRFEVRVEAVRSIDVDADDHDDAEAQARVRVPDEWNVVEIAAYEPLESDE